MRPCLRRDGTDIRGGKNDGKCTGRHCRNPNPVNALEAGTGWEIINENFFQTRAGAEEIRVAVRCLRSWREKADISANATCWVRRVRSSLPYGPGARCVTAHSERAHSFDGRIGNGHLSYLSGFRLDRRAGGGPGREAEEGRKEGRKKGRRIITFCLWNIINRCAHDANFRSSDRDPQSSAGTN
jgi:hypothetical protein